MPTQHVQTPLREHRERLFKVQQDAALQSRAKPKANMPNAKPPPPSEVADRLRRGGAPSTQHNVSGITRRLTNEEAGPAGQIEEAPAVKVFFSPFVLLDAPGMFVPEPLCIVKLLEKSLWDGCFSLLRLLIYFFKSV